MNIDLRKLPLKNPNPNAIECVEILMGRVSGKRTPLIEYIIDDVVMKPIQTDLFGNVWVDLERNRQTESKYLDNMIDFWYHMGYDCIRFERNMGFVKNRISIDDTALGSSKERAWADEHQGLIQSWDDFEQYPWPSIENVDFFPYEYINDHLPEGMGIFSSHGGGIFEHLTDLFSVEGLCFAIFDNHDLVKAVVDNIGSCMDKFYKQLLDLDKLYAIFPGDDMGFHSNTLISPDLLRELIFPWHRHFADLAHSKGKPYFLHSCGNLKMIYDDLIDQVGIDGKHSFEDSILPVSDFQQRYGDRVASLGGLDIHFLSTSTPEQIRERTHWLIDTCGSRGRYGIGSGNSIPSYIPVDNYLSMVDEALCS
jgi:uroporphyrinogen decarboxylase